MKRLLFLCNPNAGKGKVKNRIFEIVDRFTKAGWLVTIHPTQGKDDATVMATDWGGSFDRVVCCGGDGTLHETVNGLMNLTSRPVVGYIPAGSTNDFAKNLHLPRSFADKVATAASGVPRAVDVGRFNDMYFVYVAAFGVFTDVSYGTPQPFKNMFGHLAYVMEGAARLTSIQSYKVRVEHDNGVEEGDFIFGMVSNTVSVGGFRGMSVDQVKLDDGLFEVVLVREPKNLIQLQSIMKSLMQTAPEPGGSVVALRTAKLRVTSVKELPWTLDGEYGGSPCISEIENIPQAVKIVHGK